MRKDKIEVGKTYRNKTGNSARKVLVMVNVTEDMKDAGDVGNGGRYCGVGLYWVNVGETAVIYEQVRGQGIGAKSALSLASFATWAADADDGLACLSRRASKLRSLLGPGGKLRQVIGGYAPPSESHFRELDEALAELEG